MGKKDNNACYDERVNVLNSSGNFKIVVDDEKVGKKKRKLLKALKENASEEYIDLIRKLDIKPSKLDKEISDLAKLNFIKVDGSKISITAKGIDVVKETKKQKDNNSEFKEFVDALSEEEFKDFCNRCDQMNKNVNTKEEPINIDILFRNNK